MVIHKVGVGSAVKLFGVLYALLGFLIGACFGLFALVGLGMAATASDEAPAWLGSLFGVGAIIFFPIFYGCIGALSGLIGSLLYNLVANLTGGLEVEVQ